MQRNKDEQLSTINDTLVYVIGLMETMRTDQDNVKDDRGSADYIEGYFEGMGDCIDLLKDVKKNY